MLNIRSYQRGAGTSCGEITDLRQKLNMKRNQRENYSSVHGVENEYQTFGNRIGDYASNQQPQQKRRQWLKPSNFNNDGNSSNQTNMPRKPLPRLPIEKNPFAWTPNKSVTNKSAPMSKPAAPQGTENKHCNPFAERQGPKRLCNPFAEKQGPKRLCNPFAEKQDPAKRLCNPFAEKQGPKRLCNPFAERQGPKRLSNPFIARQRQGDNSTFVPEATPRPQEPVTSDRLLFGKPVAPSKSAVDKKTAAASAASTGRGKFSEESVPRKKESLKGWMKSNAPQKTDSVQRTVAVKERSTDNEVKKRFNFRAPKTLEQDPKKVTNQETQPKRASFKFTQPRVVAQTDRAEASEASTSENFTLKVKINQNTDEDADAEREVTLTAVQSSSTVEFEETEFLLKGFIFAPDVYDDYLDLLTDKDRAFLAARSNGGLRKRNFSLCSEDLEDEGLDEELAEPVAKKQRLSRRHATKELFKDSVCETKCISKRSPGY